MSLNKNELISLVATNKPDNTTGEITPAKSRQVDEQSITSSANLFETLEQEFLGPIKYPGQGTVGYSSVGSFVSVATQAGVEDVATTVTFGAGGTTADGSVTVASDGVVTINTAGYFSIKQRFRAGRTGASGVSQVFFWAEISTDGGSSWAVTGNSVDIPLSDSNDTIVFFDLSFLSLPAGVKVRNRFARSSTGNNSGDLRAASPSAALQALGVQDAPSAQITVYRIVQ